MVNKVSLRQIVSEYFSLPLPISFRISPYTISFFSHRRYTTSAFDSVVSGLRRGANEIFVLLGCYAVDLQSLTDVSEQTLQDKQTKKHYS
jgi:hypothetical protein